jgi:hypothetical protein
LGGQNNLINDTIVGLSLSHRNILITFAALDGKKKKKKGITLKSIKNLFRKDGLKKSRKNADEP